MTPKRSPVPGKRESSDPRPADAAARRIVDIVLKSLDDDKAEDAVVIDLLGKTSFADRMVIATGRSTRQVSAMADHLLEKLKADGVTDIAIEGKTNADWVLVDAGDVIVHLFRPEVRAFYGLEKMWDADGAATTAIGA